MEPHVPDILRVIQLVVAPVFLLTAVGMLINALNARLGRAVDRRRMLESRLRELSGEEADAAREELGRIEQRVRYVYVAILCALFVCLLIAGAFVGAFVATEVSRTIASLFVLAMLALIVSLLLFLREIFLAVSTPRHVQK